MNNKFDKSLIDNFLQKKGYSMNMGFFKNIIKFIMPIISIVIVVLSGLNFFNVISSISLKEIYSSIILIKLSSIFFALLFAALSYICLVGYDFIAVTQTKVKASFSLITLAAFSSYCICFNLGFPVLTGPAIRYWLYSREHVSAKQIVYITTIISITFLLGLVVLASIGLILGAEDLGRLYNYNSYINISLGIFILTLILIFLAWNAIEERSIQAHEFTIGLPSNSFLIMQLIIGGVEQAFAAGTLYQFIPSESHINFYSFSVIYILSCIVGIISHSPGGIGVFESSLMHALPQIAPQTALAGLFMFRIIYYLLPFLLTIIILLFDQRSRKWSGIKEIISKLINV